MGPLHFLAEDQVHFLGGLVLELLRLGRVTALDAHMRQQPGPADGNPHLEFVRHLSGVPHRALHHVHQQVFLLGAAPQALRYDGQQPGVVLDEVRHEHIGERSAGDPLIEPASVAGMPELGEELRLRPSTAARGHIGPEDHRIDVQVLANLTEEIVLAPAKLQLDRCRQLLPIGVSPNRLIASPVRKHDSRAIIQVAVGKQGLKILPGFGQGAQAPAIEGILPADARFAHVQHIAPPTVRHAGFPRMVPQSDFAGRAHPKGVTPMGHANMRQPRDTEPARAADRRPARRHLRGQAGTVERSGDCRAQSRGQAAGGADHRRPPGPSVGGPSRTITHFCHARCRSGGASFSGAEPRRRAGRALEAANAAARCGLRSII